MLLAQKVFENAIRYLENVKDITNSDDFKEVVEILSKDHPNRPYRIWTTGLGKAGLVARKMAATLSSNSIPAAFIHAAEARHGDFGAIRGNDILIAFSNSGQTSEVIQIARKAKENNSYVILITGDNAQQLSEMANRCLCYGKVEEACLLGLTPTTSTTIMLTIADAIVMAVQETVRITYAEYYRNHHAGYLGQVANKKAEEELEE